MRISVDMEHGHGREVGQAAALLVEDLVEEEEPVVVDIIFGWPSSHDLEAAP